MSFDAISTPMCDIAVAEVTRICGADLQSTGTAAALADDAIPGDVNAALEPQRRSYRVKDCQDSQLAIEHDAEEDLEGEKREEDPLDPCHEEY